MLILGGRVGEMLHKLQKEGGVHYHGQKEQGACYREREQEFERLTVDAILIRE